MLEKIKFSYTESDSQNNLFSPYHTKFDCMIKYNGKQFSFPYQCNTAYMMPNLTDCMDAILLDANSFAISTDILDFALEYGYDCDTYEDRAKVRKIYKACERAYNRVHALFTDAEIEAIENEIEGN